MSNPSQDDAVRAQTLGRRVEKLLAAAADANIFTTFGQVLITLLYGQVTVAEASGATTIKLVKETGTIDLCAATTVTTDPIGTLYFLTGERAVILNGTAHVPIIDVGANKTGMPSSPVILGRTATADAIELAQTGTSATLVILWSVFYIPLEEGAYIEAA
jgi:hypothetical protein